MRKHVVPLTTFLIIIFSIIAATPSLAAGAVQSPPSTKATAKEGTPLQKPAVKSSDIQQKKATTQSAAKAFNQQPQIAKGAESVEQEETGTALELSAVVPADFKQTILVNFISGSKENVMARLDSLNGYLYSEEGIKPGTYKVDFINIVGENATDYNIEASKQAIVKEGAVTKFKLQLSLKPTAKKQAAPLEKSTKEPTDERMKHLLNGTDSSSSSINNSPSSTEFTESANTKPDPKPLKPKYTLDPTTLRLIICGAIIGVLALMAFLYKQISYKHDYYDC